MFECHRRGPEDLEGDKLFLRGSTTEDIGFFSSRDRKVNLIDDAIGNQLA